MRERAARSAAGASARTWHHEWMRARSLITGTVLAGAAGLGYAAVVERNWFALRRYDVPVLPEGPVPPEPPVPIRL